MHTASVEISISLISDNVREICEQGNEGLILRRIRNPYQPFIEDTTYYSPTDQDLKPQIYNDNIGIDFKLLLKQVADRDKSKEDHKMGILFYGISRLDLIGDMSDASINKIAQDFLSETTLKIDHDRLADFIYKDLRTRSLLAQYRDQVDVEKDNLRNVYKYNLRKIWGEQLVIKEENPENLIAAYNHSTEAALSSWNEKGKVIPFDEEVEYTITLDGEPHEGMALSKDLPAALFDKQKQLFGCLPEGIPRFRIFLDYIAGPDNSYRLACEGNTVDELIEGIRAQKHLSGKLGGDINAFSYRISVQSFNDQNGFFYQTGLSKDPNVLYAEAAREIQLPSDIPTATSQLEGHNLAPC